ncbi:MAG: DEAD/DEAH box helicase family protein [Solirubrobacterales bacterium]|nr:DEAD/DEAH box helicase family protein [Solirubrobacterales bacterium]
MSSPAPRTSARPLPAWPADRPLRAWQAEALDLLLGEPDGSFLASATPAAGKTTFGLKVAHELLRRGLVGRVAIAAPTTHICRQWAADAARYGIDLEPNRPNGEGPEPRDRHGVAVTYQTVAAGPAVHRRAAAGRRTLLIADEPHHMGELAAWGQSAADAFGGAALRLLLSGTPFRSDNTAIPWVDYDDDGLSSSDFAYSYTDALVDGVCRPITFMTYGGEMEWVSGGETRRFDFDVALPRQEAARRLRTALDPDGDWVGEVLRDADARLTDCRADGHPDAGGLVVAADKEHARRLAARLAAISGDQPAIVTSDDPGASAAIERFARGSERWLVSVLMVSEGVDIPRLRVGVYATAARTELFFRQVVGRFVRRTPAPSRQMSFLLLPADPQLKRLAAAIEEERRHALALDPALEERDEPVERSAPTQDGFVALSSNARLDDVILSTTRPGDALHLFADESSPDLATTTVPPERDEEPETAPTEPEPAYVRRRRLRDRRSQLVAEAARGSGEEHRAVNARLNRAVGIRSVNDATDAQLERSIALLERELGLVG